MANMFGGPKRDKAAEAMQARQRNDAARDRAELEAEKAAVSGAGRKSRTSRASLKSTRAGSLKSKLGV